MNQPNKELLKQKGNHELTFKTISLLLTVIAFSFTVYQYIQKTSLDRELENKRQIDESFSIAVRYPSDKTVSLGYVYFNIKKFDTNSNQNISKRPYYEAIAKQISYELDFNNDRDLTYGKAITESVFDSNYIEYISNSKYNVIIISKIIKTIMISNELIRELSKKTALVALVDTYYFDNMMNRSLSTLYNLLFILRRHYQSLQYQDLVQVKPMLELLYQINPHLIEYLSVNKEN